MEETVKLSKKEKRMLKKQQILEEVKKTHSTSKIRTVIYWILGIVVVTGLFWWMKQTIATPTTLLPVPTLTEIADHDHAKGATESAKLLVEYSDFQCPACAAYHPVVNRLMEEHGDEITLVYRHFPLRQIHRNAQLAGQAAEAAHKQGKFWEMADLLFTNQNDWDTDSKAPDIFVEYATELGLNTDTFRQDMSSQSAKDKVNADYASGIRASVNSTPSFFLNGERVDPGKSYEEFVSNLGLQQ